MKKSYIALLFTVLGLALLVPASFSLAGTQYTNNQNPNQNQNQNQRQNRQPATPTVIKSIDAGSITISGPKKTTLTYKITNLTEIDFKGNRVTAADLKPGMRVVVTVGLDPANADLISADDAPKNPPKGNPKPTPKKTPAPSN